MSRVQLPPDVDAGRPLPTRSARPAGPASPRFGRTRPAALWRRIRCSRLAVLTRRPVSLLLLGVLVVAAVAGVWLQVSASGSDDPAPTDPATADEAALATTDPDGPVDPPDAPAIVVDGTWAEGLGPGAAWAPADREDPPLPVDRDGAATDEPPSVKRDDGRQIEDGSATADESTDVSTAPLEEAEEPPATAHDRDAAERDGEPEPLLASEHVATATVDGRATFRIELLAGQVLGVAGTDDGPGGYRLDLVDDRGISVASAERGALDADGARNTIAVEQQLWHLADRDGHVDLHVTVDPGSATFRVELLELDGPLHTVVYVEEIYPSSLVPPAFTFEGRAGQLAIIKMESPWPEALDPAVRLFGPDGEPLGQDDTSGAVARLCTRLGTTGSHLVHAATHRGLGPWDDGFYSYTLTVQLGDLLPPSA